MSPAKKSKKTVPNYIKARLLCEDPEHPINQLVDVISLEPSEIETSITTYHGWKPYRDRHPEFVRIIHNTFFETISDYVYDNFDVKPSGYYKLHEVTNRFKKHGIKTIKEYCKSYPYEITLSGADEASAPQTVHINLYEVLLVCIEGRNNGISITKEAGFMIIESMKEFVKMATWHCEMVDCKGQRLSDDSEQKPLMWFGLDDDPPEKGWIVNPHCFSSYRAWKKFWFPDNVERDPRVKDWCEIGVSLYFRYDEALPVYKANLFESCPITVTDQMTADEVEECIERYYRESHSGQ